MSTAALNHVFFKNVRVFHLSTRLCHSKTKKIKSTTDYCVQLVRNNENENFLSCLLLKGDVRQAALAVRAFNIEVARVSDQSKEMHILAMRMKFWQDTLDQIYNNNPPQHPVAIELSRAVAKHKLHKKNLKRLLTARSDMTLLRFNSILDMEKYCEETVSPIFYLTLQAAGCTSIEADHAASHLGKAQGLVTLLRSIPHNAARKNLPLPSNLLAAHRVSQESVFRCDSSSELSNVIYEVASSAKIHLNKARSLKDQVDKRYRAILLPAVAVDSYLDRLLNANFDIFDNVLVRRNPSLGFKLFWNKLTYSF